MRQYTPDRKTFAEKTKQGNTVSVYREILADMETPVSAFKKIDDGSFAFLLESVEGGERIARYSFIGADPIALLTLREQRQHLRQFGIAGLRGGDGVSVRCDVDLNASRNALRSHQTKFVLSGAVPIPNHFQVAIFKFFRREIVAPFKRTVARTVALHLDPFGRALLHQRAQAIDDSFFGFFGFRCGGNRHG